MLREVEVKKDLKSDPELRNSGIIFLTFKRKTIGQKNPGNCQKWGKWRKTVVVFKLFWRSEKQQEN